MGRPKKKKESLKREKKMFFDNTKGKQVMPARWNKGDDASYTIHLCDLGQSVRLCLT